MKRYTTKTKNTCWRDTIACILGVNPKLVPDFVHEYRGTYFDETRRWLADKFNKGMVYIPARLFMETCKMRQNGPIGPAGYSMAYLTMISTDLGHVAVALNGGLLWDNGSSREDEYEVIRGYYVIYDLDPPAAKWVKGKKPKLPKEKVIIKKKATKEKDTDK